MRKHLYISTYAVKKAELYFSYIYRMYDFLITIMFFHHCFCCSCCLDRIRVETIRTNWERKLNNCHIELGY